MTHRASQADLAFRIAFERCEVTPAQFDHESHLRLAYVYLVAHDPIGAQQRMRDALLAFLQAYGIPPEKYHETLTRSWVLAVRHFMGRSASGSFSEFLTKSQPLRDSKVMLTHYSAQKLFSVEARAGYVEPDLEPIPP